MTKDDVIRLAREADWPESMIHPIIMAKLADFAKLVAEHERSECAKVADELVGQDLEHNFSALIAHNIRARNSNAT